MAATPTRVVTVVDKISVGKILEGNSRIANRALEVTGLRERFAFAGNVPDALKNSP